MTFPDGPQTPPFLQLIQWIARPAQVLETCARRYGDTFTLRLGELEPIVFFSNPNALGRFLLLHQSNLKSVGGTTFYDHCWGNSR
jgi:cytochrome P450